MRIIFNECDRLSAWDLFSCLDYDCFLNGKLFEKHWCVADEKKGEIQIFKKDENNKCMLNKSKTEVLRETFKGIVELKLKQNLNKGAGDE